MARSRLLSPEPGSVGQGFPERTQTTHTPRKPCSKRPTGKQGKSTIIASTIAKTIKPSLSSSEVGTTRPYPCPTPDTATIPHNLSPVSCRAVQWSHVCMGGMVRRGRGVHQWSGPCASPSATDDGHWRRAAGLPRLPRHTRPGHMLWVVTGASAPRASFIEGHDLVCVVDQAGPANWAL